MPNAEELKCKEGLRGKKEVFEAMNNQNSDPNLNVLHIVRMFYSENFSQKLQVRLIKVSVSLCLWQTTLGCLLKAAIRTIYTSSLNGLNYFKNATQINSEE